MAEQDDAKSILAAPIDVEGLTARRAVLLDELRALKLVPVAQMQHISTQIGVLEVRDYSTRYIAARITPGSPSAV